MEALYIMIPFTLVLSGAALVACLWAIKKGQYDDTDTPALRILTDDFDDNKVLVSSPLNNQKTKQTQNDIERNTHE